MLTRPNFGLTILAIVSSCLLLACNPDDVIKEYFAGAGLNQLLTPRPDIVPGAVFSHLRRHAQLRRQYYGLRHADKQYACLHE